ncbi:MAG: hypothetical protein M1415_02455, partial [Firmicutes bacterium]|nr:hypothetical protein [Bacillota bacterium]
MGVPSYSWTHPLAERAVLSHQVERGLIAAVALSQWRPWPEWEEVAEHIVWLCRPFSQEALGLAANLLTTTGTQWLDPQWINAKSQDGVLTKWRRLVPDRDRLSSLWRLKRSGHSPMMAGQAIFQELGLDPQALIPKRDGISWIVPAIAMLGLYEPAPKRKSVCSQTEAYEGGRQ